MEKMKEMLGGCCVCLGDDGWDDDPLVFCDGQNCNVAVHKGLYRHFPSYTFFIKFSAIINAIFWVLNCFRLLWNCHCSLRFLVLQEV